MRINKYKGLNNQTAELLLHASVRVWTGGKWTPAFAAESCMNLLHCPPGFVDLGAGMAAQKFVIQGVITSWLAWLTWVRAWLLA